MTGAEGNKLRNLPKGITTSLLAPRCKINGRQMNGCGVGVKLVSYTPETSGSLFHFIGYGAPGDLGLWSGN